MNAPDSLTLACLQMIRLKGRVSADALATSLGQDSAAINASVQILTDDNLVLPNGNNLRITAEGRATLAQWATAERSAVDHSALEADYHRFDVVNRDFKQLVSDWQLRDGQPNDHSDAAYDAAIVARLQALDRDFAPLLTGIVNKAPRLAHYPQRLANAQARLQDGDGSWLARPIADSYHTVWFELHEDLIGLLGLSRVEEAAAGRAE